MSCSVSVVSYIPPIACTHGESVQDPPAITTRTGAFHGRERRELHARAPLQETTETSETLARPGSQAPSLQDPPSVDYSRQRSNRAAASLASCSIGHDSRSAWPSGVPLLVALSPSWPFSEVLP
jgi:hypothetical protein